MITKQSRALVKSALLMLFLLFFYGNSTNAQELKRKAMLGVRMEALTDSLIQKLNYQKQSGVFISNVLPNSTANKLGLEKGGILERINQTDIQSFRDVGQALRSLRDGDHLEVSYFINGKSKLFSGKAIGRPLEAFQNADVTYGQVNYDGNKLRTILCTPKNQKKSPVVYFLQGYTCYTVEVLGEGNPVKKMIQAWLDAGYAVFRVEKPGLGDSESENHCSEIDFPSELQAFSEGYQHLEKLKKIDTKNIFLFGHSMGGVIAPILAKEFNCKGVITYGTVGKTWYKYMQDIFTEQQKLFNIPQAQLDSSLQYSLPFIKDMLVHKKTNTEIVNTPHYKQYLESENLIEPLKQGQYIGRHISFWQTLSDVNIPKAWAKLKTNVLVLHGEYDVQAINQKYAKEIVDIVNQHKGKASFKLIEKTDHVFLSFKSMQHNIETLSNGTYRAYMRENYNPAVVDESIKWLNETLQD